MTVTKKICDKFTIKKFLPPEKKLIIFIDLLDITKITKNKVALNFRHIDIHKELQHTLTLVKHDIQDKEIQLELQLEAVNTVISCDSSRLQQIFWNIVKNAVKFTQNSGKIMIHTFNHMNEVFVTVKDSGIGKI